MKFFYDVGAIVRFHTVISTPPCLYSPNQRRKRMKLVFILQCLILLNALCFLDLASGEDSKTSKEKDRKTCLLIDSGDYSITSVYILQKKEL